MSKPLRFQELQRVFSQDGQIKEHPSIFTDGNFEFDDGVAIVVTPEFRNNLIEAFTQGVRGQRIPITKEHQDGEAYGWIDVVFNEGQEVKLTVEWTDLGEIALKKKHLVYLSPEVYINYTEQGIGRVWPVVLRAVSLTNFPKIKRLTSVLVGFSENEYRKEFKGKEDKNMPCGNDETKKMTENPEEMNPEKNQENLEEEFESLSDIATKLQEIFNSLKSHPEWANKTGKPEGMALFKASLNKIKSFVKEDKPMADMPNETTKMDSMMSNEPAKASENKESVSVITLAEVTKLLEVEREKMKLAFSEQIKEVQKKADERVQLAEVEIKILQEESIKKEDEMKLSEWLKDGKVLDKEKDEVLLELKKARKVGVVKLSETESYDDYQKTCNRYDSRKPIVEYGKTLGSSFVGAVNSTSKADDVIKLAEKYEKENKMTKRDAILRARKELGYEYAVSREN